MGLSDVIFDMDGLLIDSEPLWMATERNLARTWGVELTDAELHSFQGSSSRSVCARIAQRHPNARIDPLELLEQLLERMEQEIVHAPLLPGAAELVHWLARQGVNLAIASSSPLGFIEVVVRKHRLPIEIFASGTEVPVSKPHPDVFLLAAKRMGAEPGRCWVWEDSVNGTIAARAAGMQVVAVPEAGHPNPEQFSIAQKCHQSLWQSLQWVQGDPCKDPWPTHR